MKDIQILDDHAVSTAKFFNFDAYAEALARIIGSEGTSTHLVVGIFGEWGSGKTSLMKTVEQKIKNGEVGYPAKTIWFNAWKYDKEDAVWRALLMRVLEELKTEGDENLNKKLDDLQTSLYHEVYREEPGALIFLPGKAITGILKLSLSMLPVIGETIGKLVKTVDDKDAIKNLLESVQREKKIVNIKKVQFLEEYQHRFEKIIEEYYVKRKKRAVIFIDDLDRCIPEKVIEVLEAIKLFLDVKGCNFILGIDRRVVAQSIRVKYGDIPITGEDYLEKIIQLSFQLPPIVPEKIEEFIKTLNVPEFYTPYLNMIIRGIDPNPRKIKRFFNIIELQRNLAEAIPEIKEDLDKSEQIKERFEALLIEWQIISSYHPDFRKAVLREPEILLRMHDYLSSESPGIHPEESPEELRPFLDDTRMVELIKAFPLEEIPELEDIKRVIYLSRVTCVEAIEEIREEVEEGIKTKSIGRTEVIEAIKEKKSLIGANLREADLKGLNLRGMNLNGSDLTGADLREAKLVRTNLNSAMLANADMKDAVLNHAKLWHANLREALLRNTKLKDAELYSANMASADLSGADLTNAGLMGAHMEGTKMNGAILLNNNLRNAKFDDKTDFRDAEINSVTIDNLKNSNWEVACWDKYVLDEIKKKYGEGTTT